MDEKKRKPERHHKKGPKRPSPGTKPAFKGRPPAIKDKGAVKPFEKRKDPPKAPAREDSAATKGLNKRALLQITAELLHTFRHGEGPADRTASEYFRKRKFLGASDRAFIGDVYFHALRHLRRYDEAIFSAFSGQFIARPRAAAGFPLTQPIGAITWEARAPKAGHAGPMPRWVPSDRLVDTLRVGLAAVEMGAAAFEDLAGELARAWPKPRKDGDAPEKPEEERRPAPAGKSPLKDIGPAAIERMTGRALEQARAFARPGAVIHGARRHSFPDWLWAQLSIGRNEEDLQALAASLAQPAPVALRVNTLATTIDEAEAALRGAGIAVERGRLSPETLLASDRIPRQGVPGFKEGWLEFQDEGSQLVTRYCGAAPGMTVIDACAGGGGKTLHLAALMENRGRLLALDVDSHRLEETARRAARAGVSILEPPRHVHGGMPVPPDVPAPDLVLIDAPCTGTGTLRRSPDQRWRLSQARMEGLRQAQLALLEEWAPHIPAGGILVYATCSLLDIENGAQVVNFLHRHPGFVIEPPPAFDGPLTERGELATNPGRDGCDGFYAARLVRRS